MNLQKIFSQKTCRSASEPCRGKPQTFRSIRILQKCLLRPLLLLLDICNKLNSVFSQLQDSDVNMMLIKCGVASFIKKLATL